MLSASGVVWLNSLIKMCLWMDKVSDWLCGRRALDEKMVWGTGSHRNELRTRLMHSEQLQDSGSMLSHLFISEKGMHSDGSKIQELGWVYSIVKSLSLTHIPTSSSWRQTTTPPSPVLVYPSRDLHILKFAYTNTYVYILCVCSTFTQVLTGQTHCHTFLFFSLYLP